MRLARLWTGRSVRLRTALAAAGALVPVLAAASVAGVLVQRGDLTDAAALVTEEQARSVVSGLEDTSSGAETGSRSTPEATSLGGEEALVQVLAADGTVLASSRDLTGRPALLAPPAAGGVARATLTGPVAGEADRFVAVAVPVAGRESYVVAARSLESVDAATSSTTRLLAAGSALVVLVVGAITWVLTGRALRPVEAMATRASEITADDLSARLPEPGTRDEIARLADTLNDMLQRLEASSRAQRQFVADASHELRSPIATIRTLHETAHLGTHPDGSSGQSREVLAETTRLEALVADLLLLARSDGLEARERRPVDLGELAAAEAARVRRVPVTTRLLPEVVVDADPRALARALRNLLDNAERHADRAVTLTLVVAEGTAELTVGDDGPGVPRAERERIFERFVRLDSARARDSGGTGLGLAIARQVALEHDGSLAMAAGDEAHEGHAGAGATFVLRLPTLSNPRRE